jgi:hypothetical protein
VGEGVRLVSTDPVAEYFAARRAEEARQAAIRQTYTAVAEMWIDRKFVLVILDRTGHEVWGDQPLVAARPEDMPTASDARLALTPAWRRCGDWTSDDGRHGQRWQAPVEVVVSE